MDRQTKHENKKLYAFRSNQILWRPHSVLQIDIKAPLISFLLIWRYCYLIWMILNRFKSNTCVYPRLTSLFSILLRRIEKCTPLTKNNNRTWKIPLLCQQQNIKISFPWKSIIATTAIKTKQMKLPSYFVQFIQKSISKPHLLNTHSKKIYIYEWVLDCTK